MARTRLDVNDDSGQHVDVDALVAKELNEMSLREREIVNEEIHGVSHAVEETPELVEASLMQLQVELSKIGSKPAYDQAKLASPEYITSRKFCLRFLRAQLFDTRKTALHIVDFLQGKSDLFGPQTLGRPLYYSDLGDDDQACLKSGAYQVLPMRDTVGRPVVINCMKLVQGKCYNDFRNMLRSFAYIIMSLFEDADETQRKGYCGIVYYVGADPFTFDRELESEAARINDWLPARIASIHVCSDNSFIQTFRSVLMAAWTRTIRVRLRIHVSSATECRYSMMTFGLPVESLPISYDGSLKLTNHNKWVEKHQVKDKVVRSLGLFDGIDIPGEKDVLLVRGKMYQEYSGNVLMRRHILSLNCLPSYQNLTRKAKVRIYDQVIQHIMGYGGRFLKRDEDGWWVQATHDEAQKRVQLSFRTALAALAKQQQETSSTTFVVGGEQPQSRKRERPYSSDDSDHNEHLKQSSCSCCDSE